MAREQEPPYCIQIEFTEGCNLRCTFCGLNGIRGKENNFKLMTEETAEAIAAEIARLKWNCRIEFAMHGEPTQNPKARELVAIFRKHLPKNYFLMETNGSGLVTDSVLKIVDFFHAGLTTLAIDEYENIKWAQKIRDAIGIPVGVDHIYDLLSLDVGYADFFEYPRCGPQGNPHQRKTKNRLVIIEPITQAAGGTHSVITNHAGAGGPLNSHGDGKRCAKPFRELGFRYDGFVAMCCNDWRGEYPIGSIHSMTLDDIWQSPRMNAARAYLYQGRRELRPCQGCDYTSYRVGLLPDPTGQAEVPPPNADDERTWKEALKEGPLAEPIRRPWEIK